MTKDFYCRICGDGDPKLIGTDKDAPCEICLHGERMARRMKYWK